MSDTVEVDKRTLMKVLVGGAGIGALSSGSQSATAQTANEPRIQLGQDWVITDDGTDFVIRNTDTSTQIPISPDGTVTFGDTIHDSVETDSIANEYDHIVSTDDDLQAILTEANPNDTLLLGRGRHEISEWTNPIDKPLTIHAQSLNAGDKKLQTFEGTIIKQTVAGEHGIHAVLDKQSLNLRNIGIEFDTSLASTGHGIYCDAASAPSNKTLGLHQSNWYNIAVRHLDTDHYAYYLVNPQYNDFYHLRYAHGGGTKFVNNHLDTNCGNTRIYGFMGTTGVGTADAIHFEGLSSRMNFVTFFATQNAWEGPSVNADQHYVDHTLNGGNVSECVFYNPRWENDWGGGLNLPSGCRVVGNEGVSTAIQSGYRLDDWDKTLLTGDTVQSETLQSQGPNARARFIRPSESDNFAQEWYYEDSEGNLQGTDLWQSTQYTFFIKDQSGQARDWVFQDGQNGIDRFKIDGKGFGNSEIENLSGQTGDFDGQERLDDGTNTPHRGVKCVWDDVNGVWVDQTDGTTFT